MIRLLQHQPVRFYNFKNLARNVSSAASSPNIKKLEDFQHDNASTVIIGGGAVGSSIAYHLAKMGHQKVVLLEKTELTAGSTWHAAGLTTSYHPVINMKKIHYNSLQIFSKLEEETGQEIGFHQPGSIRLAATPKSVDEFKYQMSRTGNQDAPHCLLNPDEIIELAPIVLPEKVLMGLYSPYDGHVDPYSLTQALAKGARMHGASILQGMEVQSLKLQSNGSWMIATSQGDIMADNVINASGFWAKEVGKLAGIDLPLIAVEHQYLVTSSVPEIQALKREFPVLRHMEGSCYIRQERDGFLVGTYEYPEVMKIRRDWSIDGVTKGFGKELFPSDLERLMPHLEQIMDCIPSFQSANIQTVVNGPITYAPDGLPIVGPSHLPNMWLAVGFGYGIIHSGGIGKFLAEWFSNGEPPQDLIECDPGRFGKWTSHQFQCDKIREVYGMNNATTYPYEERFAGRPTSRITTAYKKQLERGASMEFACGWESPAWFSGINSKPEYKPSFHRTNWHEAVGREWNAVKNEAGVIDLSSFGKFILEGPQASQLLSRVAANKVPKLNKSVVTHLLTPTGRVAAELTVTQVEEQKFLVVTGAGSEIHDLRWIQTVAREEGLNVNFQNVSDEMGCLSVAGPKSKIILSKLSKRFEEKFPFFSYDKVCIEGIDVDALRLTYTGELGWELYCPIEDTGKLYEAILNAGENEGICDFGSKTLNVLRLEKGFRMWSKEMNRNTNAIESGLLSFVDMTKDFIGKSAIEKQALDLQSRELVMVKIDESAPCDPKADESIWVGNKIVGNVTSGCFSYLLNQPLAFAYVPPFLRNPKTLLKVELLGNQYTAEVLSRPPDCTYNQKSKNKY